MSTDIQLALAGVYTGIENRIKAHQYRHTFTKIKAEGTFYYLTFNGAKPTLAEFAEYIYYRIIPFCLTRKKRKYYEEKLAATGDDRYRMEPTDKAKGLFVKARGSQDTTGEPGELILFILLEAFLGAPLVASKMNLKTSSNMPVHGCDGIHIRYDPATGRMTVFWGESKLTPQISSSFDKMFESLTKFLTVDADGVFPYQRDVDILCDHCDIEDPKQRELLLAYFDPYTPQSNQKDEVFACFGGFEFPYQENPEPKEPEAAFVKRFEARLKSACDLFEEKAIANKLADRRFQLLLLPFEDVGELRKAFLAKLGVAP